MRETVQTAARPDDFNVRQTRNAFPTTKCAMARTIAATLKRRTSSAAPTRRVRSPNSGATQATASTRRTIATRILTARTVVTSPRSFAAIGRAQAAGVDVAATRTNAFTIR